MSQSEFTVFSQGSTFVMNLTESGVTFQGEGSPRPRSWSELAGMSFPNPFSAVITLRDSESLHIAFAGRVERDSFLSSARAYLGAVEGRTIKQTAPQTPARQPEVPVSLVTVGEVPGREIAEFRGFVTGHSVMSRNAISDLGSDLKSVLGGSLRGIEQAVGEAIADARRQLETAARGLQADAVVGVQVAIAGLGDKAEAVVMSGTAVSTVPRRAGTD